MDQENLMLEEIQGGIYIGEGLIISSRANWVLGSLIGYKNHGKHNNVSMTDGYLNTILLKSTARINFLKFNGYDDWFIPSVNELQLIVDINPRLPSKYHINGKPIWTSTSVKSGLHYYWMNGFKFVDPSYSLTIIPVRKMI